MEGAELVQEAAGDRTVDVGDLAGRRVGQRLPGGWVDDVEHLASLGCLELAIDVVPQGGAAKLRPVAGDEVGSARKVTSDPHESSQQVIREVIGRAEPVRGNAYGLFV
jgi:hypothetical protein